MLKKLNNLPQIKLDSIVEEVTELLNTKQVQFEDMKNAPWAVRKLSVFCNDFYVGYKNTIYVPSGHVEVASSKDEKDRIVTIIL